MMTDKDKWFNVLSFVNEEYIDEANPLKQPQEQPVRKIRNNKTGNHSIFGNKVAISINAKKILAVALSGCILLAVLLASIIIPIVSRTPPMGDSGMGSGDNPDTGSSDGAGIECGFEYSNNAPLPSEFCAYKSDTNEFDIDNVSLTFFYGGIFSSDINQELENGRNIPEFDVYFGNADNEPVYAIKHCNENFISEKYRCDIITEENQSVKISYNYSEEITIPKSLLCEEQGVIRFCISGININETSPELRLLTCIYINYDVTDETVVLSPWDGYRN